MQTVACMTRGSLYDELVERLRGLPLNGRLAPGEMVPEREYYPTTRSSLFPENRSAELDCCSPSD